MTHQLDNYEVANACDSTRGVPRRAHELVHPALARAVLGQRRVVDTGAFDTLYTVLETVCRVAAPLLPLTTEEIWRGLTGGRSVHLADWPDASALPADDALVVAMDQVREVGLGDVRAAQGRRPAQPAAAVHADRGGPRTPTTWPASSRSSPTRST